MMAPAVASTWEARARELFLQLSLVVLCDSELSGMRVSSLFPPSLEVAFSVLRQPVSSHLYPHS